MCWQSISKHTEVTGTVDGQQMNNYLDAPQALRNPKKGSSFMLLHGPEGNGYEPYQMSHSNFTMEAQDRGIVDHFRNWMSSHSIDICMTTSWPVVTTLLYILC